MIRKLLLILLLCSVAFATVSTETKENRYDGDGSDTTFDFTFGVATSSEVGVDLINETTGVPTTQTETTHYSISTTNADYYSGGTVTFVTPPTATEKVYLYRVKSLTQSNNVNAQSSFRNVSTTTMENTLDGIVRDIQDVNRTGGLAIRVPNHEGNLTLELPNAVNRALEYIMFDASGNVTTTSSTADANVGAIVYTDNLYTSTSPIVNVMHSDYGTMDGTADDVQIQAAIDAASVGATVYIPPGNYDINAQIDIDKKIHLCGPGEYANSDSAHLECSNAAVTKVLNITASGAQVSNLKIGGPGANSNAAIYVDENLVFIDRVSITGGFTYGIQGDTVSANASTYVSNCYIAGCVGGWDIAGGDKQSINNTYWSNSDFGARVGAGGQTAKFISIGDEFQVLATDEADANGLVLNDVVGFSVNSYFETHAAGQRCIYVEPAGNLVEGGVISGCFFNGASTGTYAIESGLADFNNVTITGNNFTRFATGVMVNSNYTNLTIGHNKLDDTSGVFPVDGSPKFVDSSTEYVSFADGNITITGSYISDVNSISSDIATFETYGTHIIDSSGGAITGTLAAGTTTGQRVKFICKKAGNNITITVANHVTSDPEDIRLDALNEWVECIWDGTDWVDYGYGQTYP